MKKNLFEILLTIFCIGLIVQMLMMLGRVQYPISLIFGPLLYLAYLDQLGNKISIVQALLHFIPLAIVSILFFTLKPATAAVYQHVYFISTLISMFTYPSIVIFSKKKESLFVNERSLILLEILALLGFALFFFINIIYINHLSNNFSNRHAQLVIIAIILVNVAVLTWFLISSRFLASSQDDEHAFSFMPAIDLNIKDQELHQIKNKINQIMEMEHLFLDAHLSLDRLSKQTSIDKEKLEYYVLQVMNSSFEDWLASYRIKHAVELIHADSGSLKLEYLANLSGFDSRTTFNKYFKLYVGESPSNYRNKLIK
ncbi:transcriptional activator FtrA [Sphingobacterium mizutaii]|uniref:Transcriptional activator FtrA n=2 Tax=Sphingobacterium mizutaii TaxID=1010 RepID=A0AAJ4XCI2_9SPHI|nr:helix-turn-helix domain-containing protein [Sphingobacterium mizutaii]SDL03258.1 AraC-type DNA-binding protein [Sphingobacterium mizutaii]SNV50444.1 transcriptional activator FtrA [Sphingobacterium mizutaii]